MRDRPNRLHDSSDIAPVPLPQHRIRLIERFRNGAWATFGIFIAFGCLLLAMIAGSGYAGMRAGQTEQHERIESTTNAYVIDRYEQGVDLFRAGKYALAAANLEEVLKYRPDYTAVHPLLATAQAAQTPRPPTPTPTAIPVVTDKNKLIALIKSADAQSEWDAVISLSDQLRAADSNAIDDAINTMRYNALVGRGLTRIRGEDIEAGLYDLDQAEQIQPLSRSVQGERNSATAYINALSYFGADWEKTIEMLKQLSPAYRDVGTKLYEANLQAGNAYSATHDYCLAQTRFAEALTLVAKAPPKLEQKRADATQLCALATPTPSVTGTQTISGTSVPSGFVNASGVTGRILYNVYDANSGYSPLHSLNSAGPQLIGGGYQSAYQPSLGAVALNGGSAIYAWYTNGSSGQVYAAAGYWPSLSPDGTQVAYGAADGYIYVARIDNTVAPISITQGSWPIWGPSGQIAYQGCTDQCGIHLISPNNPADRRRLTTSSADVQMQWSPNGSDIVYASSYSGAWEIYTINVAGGFRQLTTFGASSATPTFSPDGGRIAFESNRDGSWGIYTMNLDGSNLQKVLDLGSTHASWQADRLAWVP